jgi:hypothetical protein
MGKKFSIKAQQLNDLISVIVVEPKIFMELVPDQGMTGLKKYDKMCDELIESNVPYSDALSSMVKAINTLKENEGLSQFVKEFGEKSPEVSEKLANLNKMVEELPEYKALKEKETEMVDVTIASDERMDMLKTIFNHKNTIEKWRNTKILLSVSEALDSAIEA